VPQIAACIPGADLTEKVATDHYKGGVIISAGPVKLEFDGAAKVRSRDNAKKIITLDASGADRKGRGEAVAVLIATLTASPQGTRVNVSLDLQLSGTAAQFGRGLVSDITAVLVNQTATTMKNRMKAISLGQDPNSVGGPQSASAVAIGLTVVSRGAKRIFSRFFLPYQATARR
jgi:carbon monoxide dehydrogenase subunit G